MRSYLSRLSGHSHLLETYQTASPNRVYNRSTLIRAKSPLLRYRAVQTQVRLIGRVRVSSVVLVTDRIKIPWAIGAPSRGPWRRLFASPLNLALLGVFLLIVLLTLVDWIIELLWFRALGYEDVFWRLLFARLAMFAIAFIPLFA